jgi:hypothetical protein
LPLGLLGPDAAYVLWMALLVTSLIVSAELLWRVYADGPRLRWLAWGVAVLFVPAMFALNVGQLSPLVLLGMSVFLWSVGRQRWCLSGIGLLLVATKPQLLHLFWIAFLLWTLISRHWLPIAWLVVACSMALAIPIILRPTLIQDFLGASVTHFPSEWVTPTWGAILRLTFGWDRSWLQFVPPLVSLLWLAREWALHGRTWCWRDRCPDLILASLCTTAYAWSHDAVLLLVPAVQVAGSTLVRRRGDVSWLVAGTYALWSILALGIHFRGLGENWFIWLSPTFWGWYAQAQIAVVRRRQRA